MLRAEGLANEDLIGTTHGKRLLERRVPVGGQGVWEKHLAVDVIKSDLHGVLLLALTGRNRSDIQDDRGRLVEMFPGTILKAFFEEIDQFL